MAFFLQLQLSFIPPFSSTPVVVLDDIQFENCADEDVPAGSDQLSCDFKYNTCSWYHDYTVGLLWERENDKLNEKSEFLCLSLLPLSDLIEHYYIKLKYIHKYLKGNIFLSSPQVHIWS